MLRRWLTKCSWSPPKLAYQHFPKLTILRAQRPPSSAQCPCMIGKRPLAKPCEQTESKVESADQRLRDQPPEKRIGNCKIRNHPNRTRSGESCKPPRQILNFAGSKAVEKEVRDDEIVLASGSRQPCAQISGLGANAISIFLRRIFERLKHPQAQVHSMNPNQRIRAQQRSSKAAVAVAQHQRTPAL